ncbi:histidine kinase [Paenibacillus filicis]|uniref:histidine kinase n=1 Tax=Paenibacillus filicis TaxID=669464 RepID=A0ABU9DDC7_9BACL
MKRAGLYPKLLLSFLIVIFVSMTGVGVFSYYMSSSELDKLIETQMSQIAGNAVHHTDLYLQSYERSMVSLLSNVEMKRFLDLPADEKGYLYYENRKMIKESSIDSVFIRNPEVAAVYLMSFEGNALTFYNDTLGYSFSQEETRKYAEMYKQASKPDGSLAILNRSILPDQQNKTLTLVRQIRGLSSPNNRGVLAIELRSAELSSLWKGMDLGDNGYFFIADEEGTFVYHPDRGLVGSKLSPKLKEQVLQAGNEAFVSGEGGAERMYMSRRSSFGGWRLVISMPLDELQGPVQTIRTSTIVVGALTLALSLWLARRFGISITRPLQELKEAMRETEKGNWAIIPVPEHRDEIAELMKRYNTMVGRLSELVDKVYQAELRDQENRLERQKAEFQSLQLQINPHFLYNTLETIVCYAFVRDSKEISEIVKALAYMLRYSVQTNLEEITVANELKHVMLFIVVLQHRIGREFELDVVVPPEFLLHHMVRLTMQPLVENVFQHAFPDGIEDYHYIRIDGGMDGDMFWISVEDNGAGIEEEALAQLREKLSANRLADVSPQGKAGGIGVVNVHRRIQMVYGDQYGLSIESQEDKGTRMIMRMPRLDEKREKQDKRQELQGVDTDERARGFDG